MATLTIRSIDEEIYGGLRVLAAQHGRSMAAEVRAILAERLASPATEYGLGSRIHARFATIGGADLDLPARNESPRAAPFDADHPSDERPLRTDGVPVGGDPVWRSLVRG